MNVNKLIAQYGSDKQSSFQFGFDKAMAVDGQEKNYNSALSVEYTNQ